MDESILMEGENVEDMPPMEPQPEAPVEERRRAAIAARRAPKAHRGPQSAEVAAKRELTREMTYMEWVDWVQRKYGWDQPGLLYGLYRVRPEWRQNVKVGGFLASREGGFFSEEEISKSWGGGDMEARVQISRGEGTKIVFFRKRFAVAGQPRSDPDTLPKDSGPVALERGDGGGGSSHVTKEIVQLLGHDTDALKGAYQESMSVMRDLTEDRAAAREEAARMQAEAAEQRYSEAKAEANRLRDDLRRQAEESTRKVAEASAGSHGLLAALLPTFNDNAARQVEQITQAFTAREARIEAQYAHEVDQLNRLHDAQLQQQGIMHQAELKRLETQAQIQLGLLQGELQMLRNQTQQLMTDNTRLRDDMLKLHLQQLEAAKREQDPVERLSQTKALMDYVKELTGADEETGEGLSGKAPDWMKLLNGLGSSLGPAITAVLDQRREQAGGGQPMVATPQGLVPLAQIQAQQAQQAEAAATRPRPQAPAEPPAPARDRVTFSREELEMALTQLSAIHAAGTPPEAAAKAVCQHLDHAMLRELARRPPKLVVEELERAGLLTGTIGTLEGQEYVQVFLKTLRTLV